MKLNIKYIFILSLIFISFCNSQHEIKLEVGYKIDKKYISENNNVILTNPSQFNPYVEIIKDSIKYIIAYDKKDLKIKYIFTDDEKFKISDQIGVGTNILLSKNEVLIYPGWNVYSKKTYNGWNPIIGYNFSNENDSTKFITKNTFAEKSEIYFKILGFSKSN